MVTSLSEALSPEFLETFLELPRTIPNYLVCSMLLIVSPVLKEASLLFSLNCVLNNGVIQEVLNSEENLLDSDGWPPVLLFFKNGENGKKEILP